MSTRAALTAGTVLSVAACATACGTSPRPSPQVVALAYMRAHPVAPVTDMTAGIVLTSDDVGFIGVAAHEAGCPATPAAPAVLTAFEAPSAGGQPACGAFTATAETPSGQVVTVSCGSIADRQACPPELTASGVYIPGPGDYIRFTSSGTIAATGDIQDIDMFAVNIPLHDTGGPVWVTTPATGGAR